MYFIKEKCPNFIAQTPLAIDIYSARNEAAHYHKNTLELVYCVSGTVHAISSYDEHVLHSGDILCINCNSSHYLFSNTENLVISFYLDLTHSSIRKENAEHTLLKLLPHTVQKHQQKEFKELHDFLLSILYLYVFDNKRTYQKYTNISVRLHQLLFTNFNVFHVTNDVSRPLWIQERFEDIMLYIYAHYSEKITLKQLSEIEHLNYNFLSSQFNDIADSFNNYLSIVRAFKSELQLLTTDDTIAKITYDNGFSAPKFYYKIFKQLYGRTPAEHRKAIYKHNATCEENIFYEVNKICPIIHQYITYHLAKSQFDALAIPFPISLILSSDMHLDLCDV